MAQRLLRTSVLGMLTFALLLGGGPVRADVVHTDPSASLVDPLGTSPSQASQQFELRSTIAFTSTRDLGNAEIYLMPMNPDGTPDLTQVQRLTNTPGNAFAALSPDGKRIVFDSNRDVPGLPSNKSDLFVMKADGTNQTKLTRGSSSATWSPQGNFIAFHASKTGMGDPFSQSPGAPTDDSDIFVMNVDDCLKVLQEHPEQDDCRKIPGEHVKNITNNGSAAIDQDADWSPDGTMIAFTSHPPDDNPANALHSELYVMRVSPNGTPVQPNPERLTSNSQDDRSPDWSPDGKRILFHCRREITPGVVPPFRLCILNMTQGGTWLEQTSPLSNSGQYLTATWSPDGKQIAFHRLVTGQGQQLFRLTITTNPDGTVKCVRLPEQPDGTCDERQLTFPPGINVFANWGVARVNVQAPAVTQPARAPAAPPVPKR